MIYFILHFDMKYEISCRIDDLGSVEGNINIIVNEKVHR